MFKNKLILLCMAVLVTVTTTSCQKKITPADIEEGAFFPITYRATQYKEPGSSEWHPVQGSFLVKFTPGEDQSGNYVMSYTSYLEPLFCAYNTNCVCSGGIEGTYVEGTAGTAPPDTAYDPMTPYTPDTGGGATTTTNTNVSTIYTFLFDLTIARKSLGSGCKQEANRQVKLVRFSNGEIIMTNDYRDQYLVPVVTPE